MRTRCHTILSISATLLLAFSTLFAADPPTATAPAVAKPYLDAAKAIETAVNAGDADAIRKFIDLQAMTERGISDIPLPKSLHDAYLAVYTQTKTIVPDLLYYKQHDQAFHLVRVRVVAGETLALFRIVPVGSEVEYDHWTLRTNYEQWTLETAADGTIRAVDVYQTTARQKISEQAHLGCFLTPSIKQADLSKFSAADRAAAEHFQDVLNMFNVMGTGNDDNLTAAYNKLPELLQHNRGLMHTSLYPLVYSPPGTAEADTRAQEYNRLFKDDPGADLLFLDRWDNEKKYEKCFAALDRILKWTGGDPELDAIRGMILLDQGTSSNAAKAETLARSALQQEKRLPFPRFVLFRSLIIQRKYDPAVAALADLEKFSGKKITNFDQDRLFAQFVASPAYKKYRAQAAPPPSGR